MLFNHLRDPETGGLERGRSYTDLDPDRVAMQDATAQMALLQFMTAGLPEVAVPSTVHCDHLIQAKSEGRIDLATAVDTNAEVYDFLESVSAKYGIGFWKPGCGIIHQVVLEQYAFPGGMMIGTDSHTPNAGGLGMIAIGVGGADAVDVMTGYPFNVRWPKLIGVHLTGELSGWSAPKDVILKVAEILTVKGGTGAIVEYFGPGADSISCTGKATICNMGAEIGATTSLFAYDDAMARYLKAPAARRSPTRPTPSPHDLRADDEVLRRPGRPTSTRSSRSTSPTLEPLINGPHTPDRARLVSDLGAEAEAEGWPHGDLRRPHRLVHQLLLRGHQPGRVASPAAPPTTAWPPRCRCMVTPGSEQVRATIERDGLLADLEAIGATVLANACGPCIGQWARSDVKEGDANVIVTSYNRNFPKRNDGFASTLAFVTSPETVVAMALAGRVDFDPHHRHPHQRRRREVRSRVPVGEELPGQGLRRPARAASSLRPDERRASTVKVVARLGPPPAARALRRLGRPGLRRPAGPDEGQGQVHHRPHLGGRALAASTAATSRTSRATSSSARSTPSPTRSGWARTSSTAPPGAFPDIAKHYHEAGQPWVAIGDENYGEGSSREHAAMEPRFRGAKAVITRSFARIHETNLKKQGVLPLTFADPATYDLIERGRPHLRPRPGRPRTRRPCPVPDHEARRHRRSTSRRCTP